MNFPDLSDNIAIFEVGPRDGLQPEPVFIPTEKKIELVNRLTDAGCARIEVTSFVHPKWVPQMKDCKEVLAGIKRKAGIVYSALIPNMRGLELAMEAGLNEVVTILSSTESHNMRNLNKPVADSLKEIEKINKVAAEHGVKVRSYIATAFGCPIEGAVSPRKVADIALQLEKFGSYEISLGDTTGMANPITAYEIPKMILGKLTKAKLAVHYHQYHGLEFANNFASLQAGISIFDSATGGLGGCPYAPGAKGNCATEVLVDMFSRMGLKTGIDLEKIYECGKYAKTLSTLWRRQ